MSGKKRGGVSCPHKLRVSPPSFSAGESGELPHGKDGDARQKNLN